MAISLLFVEDNSHKRSRVLDFLASLPEAPHVTEAHSYTSGCQKLAEQGFDIALIDISLPTYDRSSSEAGGRFRAFGGREIARKIVRGKRSERIVFITQYSSFSEKGTSYSFSELRELLRQECGSNFLMMIAYDSSQSAWKDALAATLK